MTSPQPPPADHAAQHGLIHDEKPKGHQMKPRNVLILYGSTILLFVLLIPMLDANRLLQDSTFVFFIGRALPQKLIWICFLTICLYIFLVFLFYACAREEAKTDQSVFVVFAVVLTILGLNLLMISVPLKRESMSAYQEISTNCQFGPRTQRLYEYSTVLQGIRATTACSLLKSVTMCDGYQESMPYTGFLSSMEKEFQCAGFCYGSSTSAAAAVAVAAEPEVTNTYTTTPVVAPAPSPLGGGLYSVGATKLPSQRLTPDQVMMAPSQLSEFTDTTSLGKQTLVGALQQLAQQKRETAGASMNSRKLNDDVKLAFLQTNFSKEVASEAAARGSDVLPQNLPVQNFAGFSGRLGQTPGLAPAPSATTTTTVPNVTRATPGKQGIYPPTLFSDNNYQNSCDGVAARDLKYQAMHVAQMVYCEGIFLLGSVLLGGLLKVCGFCVQIPVPRWRKPVLTGATIAT